MLEEPRSKSMLKPSTFFFSGKSRRRAAELNQGDDSDDSHDDDSESDSDDDSGDDVRGERTDALRESVMGHDLIDESGGTFTMPRTLRMSKAGDRKAATSRSAVGKDKKKKTKKTQQAKKQQQVTKRGEEEERRAGTRSVLGVRGTQRSVSLPRQLLERRSPHPAAGPSEGAATNANPMDKNPRQDKTKKKEKKAKASKARGSGGASPPFEVVKPPPPQRSVSLSASGPRSSSSSRRAARSQAREGSGGGSGAGGEGAKKRSGSTKPESAGASRQWALGNAEAASEARVRAKKANHDRNSTTQRREQASGAGVPLRMAIRSP